MLQCYVKEKSSSSRCKFFENYTEKDKLYPSRIGKDAGLAYIIMAPAVAPLAHPLEPALVAGDLDELDRRCGAERHGKRLVPPRGADRAGARGSGGHAAEVEHVGALRHEGGLVAACGTGVAAAYAAAVVARARHETCRVLDAVVAAMPYRIGHGRNLVVWHCCLPEGTIFGWY